ncbi:MAG: hypothetical protein R3E79_40535 [Caldilineaceae bacterium]
MQTILSDYNCEGQAQAIFEVLQYQGDWLELAPMELCRFRDVNLDKSADDDIVWRFCQEQGYLLLTGNRGTSDKHKSLEYVIRHLVTPTSLPVITIGNLKRVQADPVYRVQCAHRLADIVADLERYRGVMRLYLP